MYGKIGKRLFYRTNKYNINHVSMNRTLFKSAVKLTVQGLDPTVHGLDPTVHCLDPTVHGLDPTVAL